uniref:GDP-Man:Man(3)GlcNAc(2)-PP-Dol alpha-1,2-mannosyltransferase n=1 Tax=Panagrolaimus superbus TaxID=310955 RepID=A0A914XWJ0_9BILA
MFFVMFILVLIGGALRYLRRIIHERYRHPQTLAFFHPFCEGGGGGERVLFQAIDTLLNAEKRSRRRFDRIIIYSKATDSTIEDVLNNVRKRFQIELIQNFDNSDRVKIELVQLRSVWLLDPKNYPRFTLILQSIAEIVVGFEAMYKFLPEVFIDTTGCPFTLPVFAWLGGCNVACYVHYPTITAQMFGRVSEGKAMYNNADFIAKNKYLTFAKLWYYRIFAYLYRFCGFAAEVIMTNGSWTTEHIKMLWPGKPVMVYPPVDVHLYEKGAKIRNKSPAIILSVGQIRPEKNHKLQIEVFQLLKQSNVNVTLTIAGGCRNDEDNQRLENLKNYAAELNVEKYIDWKINITNEELRELNNTALIGIHTMIEEHFGIAVVESISAGCIMVAHNSGGPKYDIIKEGITGYLADTAEGYAKCIKNIIDSSDVELQKMRDEAIQDVEIFSVKNFSDNFLKALNELK